MPAPTRAVATTIVISFSISHFSTFWLFGEHPIKSDCNIKPPEMRESEKMIEFAIAVQWDYSKVEKFISISQRCWKFLWSSLGLSTAFALDTFSFSISSDAKCDYYLFPASSSYSYCCLRHAITFLLRSRNDKIIEIVQN